jgi:DNA-directed RNA polymerase sigma subunit (sigma70/sigma32)
MKNQNDNMPQDSMLQTATLTPLEERVLRMRYGVTPEAHAQLTDPKATSPLMQASLHTMEQSVLQKAPKTIRRHRHRHLRLVPPDDT